MRRGETGQYETTIVGDETVRAFVPAPLPPTPALDLVALQRPLEEALLALGRLDSLSVLLPDAHLFLYTYVRKEAVLSSQIEGTQSSLSDLLLFELEEVPGTPLDDVVEVSNYVTALEHGLRRMRKGFPLCNRLIREIHAELLARGRGSDKTPGEFRRSQNWIGGSRPGTARFVPAPAHAVAECMSDLERFLHTEACGLPALLRAGLAHVQFETIHPFLDGNGRVGRLLITFLLCHDGVLREPLLYLSLYFKQHRESYYELLNDVRKNGDWEDVACFLSRRRDADRGRSCLDCTAVALPVSGRPSKDTTDGACGRVGAARPSGFAGAPDCVAPRTCQAHGTIVPRRYCRNPDTRTDRSGARIDGQEAEPAFRL